MFVYLTTIGKMTTRAILVDITGVLYESSGNGGKVIEGSPEAIHKLRQAGYRLKFCTNETSITKKTLVTRLRSLGYSLSEEEIHSPAPACIKYLTENNLRPYLLVHPDAMMDYEGLDTDNPNCVVIADARDAFTYQCLNQAFRLLMEKRSGILISLGKGCYYKEGEELTLDVGPFMKALEYATGVSALVIGKPAPSFFMSALQELQVSPENAVMVGDDLVNDVGGAQKCGLMGILVRTGKYRPEDEHHRDVKPDKIVDNFSQAVEFILSH